MLNVRCEDVFVGFTARYAIGGGAADVEKERKEDGTGGCSTIQALQEK